MTKSQLMKFSLSVVCAAVLAACSSGGGSGGNAPAPVVSKGVEGQPSPGLQGEKPLSTGSDGNGVVLERLQGGKFVKKNESNFVLDKFEVSSASQGGQSSMNIELHKSLDTVVISVPLTYKNGVLVRDETRPIGYVEDFDFRKDAAGLANARTNGKTTLEHIYKASTDEHGVAQGGSTTDGVVRSVIPGQGPKNEAEAISIRGITADTKTATKGKASGDVLVYQTGRVNYIGSDEKVKGSNSDLASTSNKEFRDRSGTVAEVYGHRTFVLGNAEQGTDATDVDREQNAPFGRLTGDAASGTYQATRLNHVQYGRVTSKLHDVAPSAVKAGINSGLSGTKVVSYGEYQAKGTESSYFFRGVNKSGRIDGLADTYAVHKNGVKTPTGELTYQGHAVTYGFTHIAPKADIPDAGKLPNAVAPNYDYDKPELVSGTHVAAKIDLATKTVTGSLYDVWKIGSQKSTQNIATFNGTLTNTGEISGQSQRTEDNAKGSFLANLYGVNAEELGGGLTSNAKADNDSWGATFGAKVQNSVYVKPTPLPEAPKPVQPSVTVGHGWGVATEGNR